MNAERELTADEAAWLLAFTNNVVDKLEEAGIGLGAGITAREKLRAIVDDKKA